MDKYSRGRFRSELIRRGGREVFICQKDRVWKAKECKIVEIVVDNKHTSHGGRGGEGGDKVSSQLGHVHM